MRFIATSAILALIGLVAGNPVPVPQNITDSLADPPTEFRYGDTARTMEMAIDGTFYSERDFTGKTQGMQATYDYPSWCLNFDLPALDGHIRSFEMGNHDCWMFRNYDCTGIVSHYRYGPKNVPRLEGLAFDTWKSYSCLYLGPI